MKKTRISNSLIYSIIFLSLSAVADEHANETNSDEQGKAPAEQKVTSLVNIDSPVAGYQALSVAGEQIDAAYIEESLGQRYGAVMLFHDLGQQYETRDVITQLRHELPQYGWSTLTLSLASPPEKAKVLLSANLEQAKAAQDEGRAEADSGVVAKLPEVSNEQRVQAALAFLKAKEVEQILFLGHGDGGRVAVEALSQPSQAVLGLILVNAPELDEQLVQALELPIFDIYGSNALSGTESAVKQRALLMKRSQNATYSSREVIGANHVFYGLDRMLGLHVRGWLKKTYQQGNR